MLLEVLGTAEVEPRSVLALVSVVAVPVLRPDSRLEELVPVVLSEPVLIDDVELSVPMGFENVVPVVGLLEFNPELVSDPVGYEAEVELAVEFVPVMVG